LSSLESYKAAALDDWTTKEGRAAAKQRYGLAATIMRTIREDLLKDDKTPSPDFTSQCLFMCQAVFSAQGQLCAYEAAKLRTMDSLTDKNSARYTLLAKIAIAAANHYKDALLYSQDNVIQRMMHLISRQWGAHFKVMNILFRARAEYFESMACRFSSRFGLEIARLRLADSMCREGLKFLASNHMLDAYGRDKKPKTETLNTENILYASLWLEGAKVLDTVPSALESLQHTITERLEQAIADNLNIFHDHVPSEGDTSLISAIPGLDLMVDCVELPCDLDPDFLARPLFASLPTF